MKITKQRSIALATLSIFGATAFGGVLTAPAAHAPELDSHGPDVRADLDRRAREADRPR